MDHESLIDDQQGRQSTELVPNKVLNLGSENISRRALAPVSVMQTSASPPKVDRLIGKPNVDQTLNSTTVVDANEFLEQNRQTVSQ